MSQRTLEPVTCGLIEVLSCFSISHLHCIHTVCRLFLCKETEAPEGKTLMMNRNDKALQTGSYINIIIRQQQNMSNYTHLRYNCENWQSTSRLQVHSKWLLRSPVIFLFHIKIVRWAWFIYPSLQAQVVLCNGRG